MSLTIKEIIQRIVRDEEELYSVIGTVTAVDEDARTIDVQPIDGSAEILDVKLQANIDGSSGFVLIPEEDSEVVVTFLGKDTAYMALATDVEKILIDTEEITINGGDNGGLIIIQNLVDKINALENAHNGLVTSFNTHTHITTATISASAVPGVIAPTTTQSSDTIAPTTSVSDLENDKITH